MDWRIILLIIVTIFVAQHCWKSWDTEQDANPGVSIYKEVPKPGIG